MSWGKPLYPLWGKRKYSERKYRRTLIEWLGFFFCGYNPWCVAYQTELLFFFFFSFSKKKRLRENTRKKTLVEWNLKCRSPIPSLFFVFRFFSAVCLLYPLNMGILSDFGWHGGVEQPRFCFQDFFRFFSFFTPEKRQRRSRKWTEEKKTKRRTTEIEIREKIGYRDNPRVTTVQG